MRRAQKRLQTKPAAKAKPADRVDRLTLQDLFDITKRWQALRLAQERVGRLQAQSILAQQELQEAGQAHQAAFRSILIERYGFVENVDELDTETGEIRRGRAAEKGQAVKTEAEPAAEAEPVRPAGPNGEADKAAAAA